MFKEACTKLHRKPLHWICLKRCQICNDKMWSFSNCPGQLQWEKSENKWVLKENVPKTLWFTAQTLSSNCLLFTTIQPRGTQIKILRERYSQPSVTLHLWVGFVLECHLRLQTCFIVAAVCYRSETGSPASGMCQKNLQTENDWDRKTQFQN